ncbi:MAG: high frequency lysogenization protein HflD [Xanthomonadales bacterium]|nr:high frequency lysogenization protein HflD [Xanthomonadales bacterium]
MTTDAVEQRRGPALTRAEARVVALAGLVQAVSLALAIARDGECEPRSYAASLASTLRLHADSAEDVYGDLGQVRSGLRLLIDQLRGGQQRDANILRIAAAVLGLERKYARNAELQNELRQRLQALAIRHSPDDAEDPDVAAGLAQAYLATISRLTPRIRVPGNPLMLKEADTVARVRACLLAGIRSAALWRQLGGAGWQLVLQRKGQIDTAQRLLGRSLAAL